MFNVTARPTFTEPVTFSLGTGSEAQKQSFTATFRAYPEQELSAFDTNTLEGQKGLMRFVTEDLSGIVTGETEENETPVAFTPEILEMVLSWGVARVALMTAFTRGMLGAKLGN